VADGARHQPASERSDWLTGRVISCAGFEVGLYANPQIIRQLSAPGPWEYDKLAKTIEKGFRPAARIRSIFRRTYADLRNAKA
jgi:hypothetical protein